MTEQAEQVELPPESIPYNPSDYQLHMPPPAQWCVIIPKGGAFQIHLPKLNVWQRVWMRFIGWGVQPINRGESK